MYSIRQPLHKCQWPLNIAGHEGSVMEWKQTWLKFLLWKVLQFSGIGFVVNTALICSEVGLSPITWGEGSARGIPVFPWIQIERMEEGMSPSAEVARLKHSDEAAMWEQTRPQRGKELSGERDGEKLQHHLSSYTGPCLNLDTSLHAPVLSQQTSSLT